MVSLQPSATLTLSDIGLLDRVVACTKYCVEVCPQVGDGSKLLIADSWSAQAEQIVAALPDLVLASVPYQLKAVAEILRAGVRFLGLAPRTLCDIYTDIVAIAAVMGEPQRGLATVARIQAAVEDVRARAVKANSIPQRVFCEQWGKPIIASQPWVAELVEAAGGEFVTEPGKTTQPDVIMAAQPDVLLAAWCGAGNRVPLEKTVEQRGWRELPAVRYTRVFCISDELLNTPASCLIGGLQAIAWALHPRVFPQPAGIRQIHSL